MLDMTGKRNSECSVAKQWLNPPKEGKRRFWISFTLPEPVPLDGCYVHEMNGAQRRDYEFSLMRSLFHHYPHVSMLKHVEADIWDYATLHDGGDRYCVHSISYVVDAVVSDEDAIWLNMRYDADRQPKLPVFGPN